jgi:diguanylate cyclase (GGDEF)-like protein
MWALPGPSFWLSAAVVAAAQFARIRVRIGADYVLVAWGEVASITSLCLIPAVWAPLAGAVGAMVAHIDRLVTAAPGQRLRVPYAICSLTIASTAAAIVVWVFDRVRAAQIHPGSVAAVAVLVLAGLAYFGTSTVLATAWLADDRGFLAAWRRTARAKGMMLPGNIAVGSAVAMAFATDARWLAGLVPVFVVVHRVYLYRARIDAGSRWWENLAVATRGLSHDDARAVTAAALRGARTLFGSAQVQVALRRDRADAAGDPWVWYGSGGPDGAETLPAAASPISGPHVVARPLIAGDAALGEMRLALDRSKRLDPAADLVFSTYVHAVANALNDAATHHDLEVMAARSAFEAVYDPLTGLPNRSTLILSGDDELRRRSTGAAAALILLDVDAFRAVNDTLSLAAGDQLLCTIGERLRGATRPGETLARLGGDEFALLLSGDSPIDTAIDRARELASLVATPVEVAGVTIGVTATVGVGVVYVGGDSDQRSGPDMAELIRRAGRAVRQARRDGAVVARYGEAPVPGNSRADRHAVLADMRDALAANDQLGVVVQPVVDLTTGVPTGAEFLVRWRHPTRGLLLPAAFIDAVEGSDLAAGLTGRIVTLALEAAADWARVGIGVPVTVNLCARCSLDPQLPHKIAHCLRAHGVPADRLILEITEGVMVADPERVERSVTALRELGVQISVGDFGNASASLELLARCRVDEVKIDRSFVAAMTTSLETAAIVAAAVDLARALGIRVVAEAVELAEQRDALMALGVRRAQGHLFYPPLSPVEAAEVLGRIARAQPVL